MHQWYVYQDGETTGPIPLDEAQRIAELHPEALAWHPDLPGWRPAGTLPELNPGPAVEPPPLPTRPTVADEVDYRLVGEDMQYVEIELDPGESVIAESGAMMFKQPDVTMETIFGDGRKQNTGLMTKLLGAGKRLLTGESLFLTAYTNEGAGKAKVAFAAPYPGSIIPVPLMQTGGSIICQKDAFLCAARGVAVDLFFQKKIMTALFGGEGFVMQKLHGDGLAFLHAGGTVTCLTLKPGQVLQLDTGCLVAMEETVDFDLERIRGIKNMFFGGEGIFMARLQGPGRVWVQSLPFSRLAGRVLANLPRKGGKGEGSLLGSAGNWVMGDND